MCTGWVRCFSFQLAELPIKLLMMDEEQQSESRSGSNISSIISSSLYRCSSNWLGGISARVDSNKQVVQKRSRHPHKSSRNESNPSGSVSISGPHRRTLAHVNNRHSIVIIYLNKQERTASFHLCSLTHQVFIWPEFLAVEISARLIPGGKNNVVE